MDAIEHAELYPEHPVDPETNRCQNDPPCDYSDQSWSVVGLPPIKDKEIVDVLTVRIEDPQDTASPVEIFEEVTNA